MNAVTTKLCVFLKYLHSCRNLYVDYKSPEESRLAHEAHRGPKILFGFGKLFD